MATADAINRRMNHALSTKHIVAAMLAAGGVMVLTASRPAGQALGLGLMFPGGGFLLGSHWLLFSTSVVLFLACCAVARTTRNPAPLLVAWLGSAAWAAEHAATAGTCQFLQLFGYAYAFRYWQPAMVLAPLLGGFLLAAAALTRGADGS